MESNALFACGMGLFTAVGVWWFLSRSQRRFALAQASHRLLRSLRSSKGMGHLRLYPHDIRYSYVPAFHNWMRKFAIMPRILLFLEQADSKINVSSFLLLHVCCGGACALIALWLHLPLWVGMGLVALATATPWMVMAAIRRRRLSRLTEQLPEAARMVASALRAGLGLESGLQMVGTELQDPIGGEFQRVLNERRLSSDSNVAFRNLARRVPTADFQLFSACVSLHHEVGGNFAQTLDQLGQTVRERFQLWRELKTLTAESRLSGWVLGALPLITMIGISALNPAYFVPMFERPAGRAMLWAGLGLQVIGFAAIRWLTMPRIPLRRG